MIEEQLTDRERHLLMRLVTKEMVAKGEEAERALLTLFAKLHGTDTVIVAHHAYASRGTKEF